MGTDASHKSHDQAATPGTSTALARLARLLARQSASACVDRSCPPTSREQTDDTYDPEAPAPSHRR